MGGRDEVGGGTWMGITKDGRLAFLTNVLEPNDQLLPTAKTRGALPVRFLESNRSPLEFAEEIVKEAEDYNGFNLIVADLCLRTMVYVSNRPKGSPITIQKVSPGIHVLSNANLDTPWHKTLRLEKNFKELLVRNGIEQVPQKKMVEKLMWDRIKADRDELPNTGCDPEWELNLSSIFVDIDTKLGRYGTRSSIAVYIKQNGEVSFYEKYIEDGVWKEHSMQFHIEKAKLVENRVNPLNEQPSLSSILRNIQLPTAGS